MASNFTLTLDTTPPNIQIYSPNYTTIESDLDVRIETTDILDNWQDIYLIDSEGTTHNLTFQQSGNELTGVIGFDNVSLGMATFYVRLRDDVGNVSDLKTHSVSVVESNNLKIGYITESVLKTSTEENVLKISALEGVLKTNIIESTSIVNIDETVRKVEVGYEL